MRVLMAFDSPTRLADSSIRYERYMAGFRQLGHECRMLTTAPSADGVDWADVVPDRHGLLAPTVWADRRPDVVVLPTWLAAVDLLAAIRPHAGSMVALADSDGCVGAGAFPRATFERMWVNQSTAGGRLRAAGWWLRQYLGVDRSVDQRIVESIRACDRVTLTTAGACDHLRAFLRSAGAGELGGRLAAVPYPVDEGFERPLAGDKTNQVVAVGRWSDPQKGGELLARAAAAFTGLGDGWRVVVVGSGGQGLFDRLATARPDRFEYRGVIAQAEMRALLDRSRILLSTSRWESGPIIAAEALLRGCSVVGLDSVPSFREYAASGCGSTYPSAGVRSVIAALDRETGAWADGGRNPEHLAARWRGAFTPAAVCERLLAGLPSRSPSGPRPTANAR